MQTIQYMGFDQRGHISTLNGGPLKLVDKFTYLGSNFSLTKNDINMWLAKAWTAINRLSVLWKSDLSNKMKGFSNQRSYQYCCMDAPQMLSVWTKSLMAITQECCKLYWTSPGGNIPQNNSYMATYHPSRKPSKLNEPDMWDTAREVRMNS